MVDDKIAVICDKQKAFLDATKTTPISELVTHLRGVLSFETELVYSLWVKVFPLFWDVLSIQQRHDLVKDMIFLLSQNYHTAQADCRPNVIQAILEGACNCEPVVLLPPQLVKFLGETFNARHTALELVRKSSLCLKMAPGSSEIDEDKASEFYAETMADIFEGLSEEDYFCGIWRTKCLFPETNSAISFEQTGMWQIAQKHYENAQGRARTGTLPFTEFEYCLWEKQWINSTKKLQQWDILTDLAKNDSNPELLLECAWRLSDWTADRELLTASLNSISNPKSVRKSTFKTFLALLKLNESMDLQEFAISHEEGVQLLLKEWHSLPSIVSDSHIPLLHAFQQFVELQEACVIQKNLMHTNANNMDLKSQELKSTLAIWRERLPNMWDDINIWSDLVSWRQHIFTNVNKAYLPLIPQLTGSSNGTTSSSYAYRGYHESAWIINRFANVARNHQLAEVCINSLSKIYTLPNIEIQEAFYKLYEQAKCHLVTLGEYSTGLDVINNTNLFYFTPTQKAEFFTLKGKFFYCLGMNEEASAAFASAVQIDMNLPNAWSSWGEYNDRIFSDTQDIKYAVEAINCYLQAAGLPSSKRPAQYLARVLSLLSLDDSEGTLAQSYESYKSEIHVWNWITYIPQLLTSLSGKEAAIACSILMRIAKAYPQSLHFQLRTSKEDFSMMKRQFTLNSSRQVAKSPKAPAVAAGEIDAIMTGGQSEEPEKSSLDNQIPGRVRPPWEYVDDIMGLIKTTFPLLALSLENMVDQILQRLKPSTDEDIYRLIVNLSNDALQVHLL